jgi:hypothetical protein
MKRKTRAAAKGKTRKRGRRSGSLLVRQLREENLFLRKQFNFYQGKCERLELAMMSQQPGGRSYVERTDDSKRPPIGSVEIPTGPKKLTFAMMREQWNTLSAEEQEAHLQKSDWVPDQPEPKKKKVERRH